ncbi:MAG TPA: GTP-binding protein [Methylophaga aminisulfidivorans]|nr:GTP-binding protein [Methylophaga sp.]HIM39257.1 GTP-binding protein [Methylophaga aminisulfidivorans]
MENTMKRLTVMLTGLFMSMHVFANTILTPVWTSPAELKNPESVIYDPITKLLYVSNVNGSPLDVDGNGFISQLSVDGKIQKLHWLDELNAPKGLALNGNNLYVSDINELVVIDIAEQRIIKRYPAEGAKFLNDVAVDKQGNVYVSDMMTDRIYRLADDKFDIWMEDPALEAPNGLLVEHNNLIVASWGHMTNGFETETPGHLKIIDLITHQMKSLGDQSPAGNLDGIEADGQGNYLVTDWLNGRLLKITPQGHSETLIEFNQGSADHTVMPEKDLVIVPMMMDNVITAFRINR